ncbi:MAG: DUF4386 domain-containing protein [Candidatus Meridianibacter frigidus]|nr:MAG: DUF4386 domain-containing protein [Candidatus Eremiobacteraeota bacterium]
MALVDPALASARRKARLAGGFYLITALTAVFAEIIVRGRLVDFSSPAATAHNILASESLYRLGFAADLLNFAAYIVVMTLLFDLLKSVNRSIALLAIFFSLAAQVVGGIIALGHLAPLLLLDAGPSMAGFSNAQLQALALFSLRLHVQGYFVALVFFGFYNLLLGYLFFKSPLFPKTIGMLVVIAGVALLTNSFAHFLSPTVAHVLNPFMDGLDGLGELPLIAWLLVIGVRSPKRFQSQ